MPLIRTSRGYPRVFGGDGAATPSPPAPWTPAALGADLLFWLDAQDASALFQDAAGTTPVTSNDHPVGLWQDKSSSGYHVSQSTDDAFRPLYKTSGINGHPALLFDASNDRLVRTVAQPWDIQTGHVFAVIRTGAAVNNTDGYEVLSSRDDTSVLSMSPIRVRSSAWRVSSTGALDGGTVAINTNYLTHTRSNGTTTVHRANGADVSLSGTNSGTWFADVTGRDRIGIGALVRSSDILIPFNGHIGSILITNELSAENWGNMETWLSERWGIALAV